MLQNLLEDYILHLQHHRNVWIGVLMLAVPSHIESIYTHHGILEDHMYHLPWSRETNKFFKAENEDIVSLLQKLTRGISIDVESFSLQSQRTSDFIQHDGEMFEVVPSSNPDSLPKDQDSYSYMHCDVKRDITKKRNVVLASDVASHEGSPFSVENGLSALSILPSTVWHQPPDIAHLCGCLKPKPVQDPFVNELDCHYDDRSILSDDFVRCPSLNIDDGLAAMLIPHRRHEDRQDLSLEDALLIDDMVRSLDTGSYCEGLEQTLRNLTQAKEMSGQEITGSKLSADKLQSTERFEKLAAKEPTFMQLSTEGLSENGFESLLTLECPTGMPPLLTSPVTASGTFKLTKWKLPNAEQPMVFNLDTECTEGNIFETEKHFLETLTLRMHVPNLREKMTCCSVVAEAIRCLHHTHECRLYSELDLTLPWDPVAKSSYTSSSQLSTQPFFDRHNEKHAGDNLMVKTTHHKFTVDTLYNDEMEECIQPSLHVSGVGTSSSTSCGDNSSKPVNTSRCEQETMSCIKNTVDGLTNQNNHAQVAVDSIEDFLFIRMATINSNKESNLASIPDKKCSVRGTAIQLIGSQKITEATDLLHQLETRHNIIILERSMCELYGDPMSYSSQDPLVCADVCVDERTGIVLHDITNMGDLDALKPLLKRLAKLSLQYRYCWVILESNLKNYSSYPYGGQTVKNYLPLLQDAATEITRNTTDCEVKVVYSGNNSETAKLIHQIVDKASQKKDDWLPKTCLNNQHSKHFVGVPSAAFPHAGLSSERVHQSKPPCSQITEYCPHASGKPVAQHSYIDEMCHITPAISSPDKGSACIPCHRHHQPVEETIIVKQEDYTYPSVQLDTSHHISSHSSMYKSASSQQFHQGALRFPQSSDDECITCMKEQAEDDEQFLKEHIPTMKYPYDDDDDSPNFESTCTDDRAGLCTPFKDYLSGESFMPCRSSRTRQLMSDAVSIQQHHEPNQCNLQDLQYFKMSCHDFRSNVNSSNCQPAYENEICAPYSHQHKAAKDLQTSGFEMVDECYRSNQTVKRNIQVHQHTPSQLADCTSKDVSDLQLEAPCSKPKKRHLICQRVPGASSGQTRLAFIE